MADPRHVARGCHWGPETLDMEAPRLPERQERRGIECPRGDLLHTHTAVAENLTALRAETGRRPCIGMRQYFLTVPGAASSDVDQVRTAEVLAALSLVTDLARRFPLE